jgi:hypothetical protein
MHKVKNFILAHPATLICAACLIIYLAYLQFVSAAFYDPDSYYHAAVTNLIKNSGLKYQFHWTQFSLFKDFYADKDLLFHLFSVPFFYLSQSLVTAGKYATIFYNALFILAYGFLLRKYLPDSLAAVLLLVPAFSATFLVFSIQFRSLMLSNICMLMAIYFIINKRILALFIVSLLYPLTHISFFMLIPFVLICEIIRYVFKREFCLRNIYMVLLGILAGVFIHPDFPNNLLSFHLNGVLVPLYTMLRVKMDFGGEFQPMITSFALLDNFAVFFIINFVLWMSLLTKKDWSFPTLAWLGCANLYLLLSFFGNRYWYPAGILFLVFFASYLADISAGMGRKRLLRNAGVFLGLYLALNLLVYPINLKRINELIQSQNTTGISYANAAAWMKNNIPAGETIYHASWSDSPYFICLNPKNNYLTVLDPIYMFYRYPKAFMVYRDLIWGRVKEPFTALRDVFKVNYGYTRRETPLYFQIIDDPKHFKVVYEDNIGAIFKLIGAAGR